MISRIFRGENENAAVKRKRQIDTLKIFNDNVVELREDADYQVQFDAGEARMAIMVSLPPEFPLEKPILRVSPPITHPWCNEHSEITSAPGLLNFTIHSDLGRVVQAIIREFSKNPPQLIDDASLTNQSRELQERISPLYGAQRYPELQSTLYNTYYNSQYPAYSTSSGSNYKYNYVNSCISNQDQFTSSLHRPTYTSTGSPGNSNSIGTASPVQYSSDHRPVSYINSHNYNATSYNKPMTVNSSSHTVVSSPEFPELNNLTNEQLVKLAEETDSLDAFLTQHSQLKDINLLIDETIDNVERLANDNLSKETELKTLKEEVASKIQSVSELKAHYDNLISQYSKLSQVFAPDHIRECLRKAADESHEQSELIAENFLERKIDVERFLSSYIECRKLGQARRTKEEKLAHQLNELKRAETGQMKYRLIVSIFLLVMMLGETVEAAKGGIGRAGVRGRGRGRIYSARMPVIIPGRNTNSGYYENKDGARIIKSSHFELDYMLGRKITFFCMARGFPRPEITWYKDDIELYHHKFFQVHEWAVGNDTIKSKMEIDPATQKDAGYYSCQADNQYAVDRRGFRTDYVMISY